MFFIELRLIMKQKIPTQTYALDAKRVFFNWLPCKNLSKAVCWILIQVVKKWCEICLKCWMDDVVMGWSAQVTKLYNIEGMKF